MIKACETCQHFWPRQSHAPLKATPPPSRPWQRLGTDLFEFDGNDYVVIADYYSNMPFLCKIPGGQCNATKVISILKEVFSEHEVPETLISDNGPQYSSALFAEFADEWKFTHVTSLPHHPEGNGFAESMVKVVKQMLQCAKYSSSDPHLALLSYRATPLDSKIASPAELMYQCHLQSTLPSCLRNTALMLKTHKKHLTTEQTNLRLIMITLQDQREHPSMQDKMYLYGILKDASGYQQRSYAVLPTEHTRSRHQLVLSIHILETTSRLIIPQLTTHLRSLRSWSHQPLQLCRTQPHQLLHLQHLLLQTSRLYHRWSHPLLQRHQQGSLWHVSLLSPHQQHLHPHLCSDDLSEPLYHHSAWSQRRSSLLINCCYWPSLSTDYDSAPLTWRQPWRCVVPAHRPSVMMWLSHMKTTATMWHASPLTIRDDVTVPTVVTFWFSISVKVATLLPSWPFLVNKILAFLIKLVRGMLYYTADEFVCVQRPTCSEGTNKPLPVNWALFQLSGT